MKITRYLYYLLTLPLVLSACTSQDEEMPVQGDAEQRIVLQVAESNSLTSRAGRPLYSNEPKQEVDIVQLFICTKNDGGNYTIVSKKKIENWMDVSSLYDNHGREWSGTLTGDERVPATGVADYTVYAIGYTYRNENETQYTVDNKNLHEYLNELTGTFPEYLTLSLNNALGEEIFAGSTSIETNVAGGFSATVELKRQVAGVYMYVKEIPDIENTTKLSLTASADNNGLVLGQFDKENVMNGTAPASGEGRFELCSINMADWKDKDGNWKNPYAGKADFQEGAYYAGCFVIPFSAKEGVQSLQIERYEGENTTPEQIWKVNLPDAPKSIWAWNATNNNFGDAAQNVTESETSYSLLRNHLYCIGRRGQDTFEDPSEPGGEEPTPPSDDNPESLKGEGSPIILKVLDNWDRLYDMELEPTPED